MSKKVLSFLTAVIVAAFIFTSSLVTVSAASYKTWLQSDSRWAGKTLGGSGETMAEIGCAVTAVAIQVVHSGSKSESTFNPGTLVDYLNKSGGLDGGGNLYWGAVTGLVSSFTFEKRAYFSSYTKTTITKELTSFINAGYYVVLSVDYDCHWVAVDTISNGVVYMMDPAQNKTNKLFDYYSASGITQVRLYKGKNAPAKIGSTSTTTPTTPKPVTHLTGHYQTTDALNLRASHTTSASILLTIPLGKTLVITQIYNNEWGETEYNGKSGWVFLEYTKSIESTYTYKTGIYKCNVDTGVNMRKGVGTDKAVVCLVPSNAQVTISSVSNNWGKATYGSNTGYICMEYLTYVSAAPATTTAATTTAATTTASNSVSTTAATTKTTAATTVTTTAKPAATTTAATTVTTAKTTAVTTTKAPVTTATTAKTTAVTTTAPTQTETTPATTATAKKGDINRDGKIDNDDVLELNLFLDKPVKLDILTTFIYDLNADGVINEIDVVYLMKEVKKQLGVKEK